MSAPALDINEHGLFIRTDVTVEPGELIRLVIDLPSGSITACVTARYVDASPHHHGIGAELFVMGDVERDRWAQSYRTQMHALIAQAVQVETIELDEITEVSGFELI